jgi:hypothetical protein
MALMALATPDLVTYDHALGEEFAVSGVHADRHYSDAEPRRTVPTMATRPDTGTESWPARCASCSADQR